MESANPTHAMALLNPPGAPTRVCVSIMIRPAEYPSFRACMREGYPLPEHFSLWTRQQRAEEEAMRAHGIRVDYVTAHHAEFIEFCEKLGKPPSHDLLVAYAITMRSRRKPW
ncbi:MAG TPA: hypothetical protein VN667_23150 [Burkholderiales bacterium]|nr:hypothetical protein [Burkholderiales bacterium]